MKIQILLLLVLLPALAASFLNSNNNNHPPASSSIFFQRVSKVRLSSGSGSGSDSDPTSSTPGTASANAGNKKQSFDLTVDLPPSGSGLQAQLRLSPILSVPSTLVVVRYNVPFGLDVAPLRNLAVCTKDGSGGERVNDVLRFTSQWTLGLPRGDGLMTTAAAFSGGLSWQCSMFDVMKAKQWEQVVQALTSNTASRTDEVVLIFERPLEGTAPELQ